MLKVRQIIVDNKIPRRLELQPNVFQVDEKTFAYKDYPESFEGIIQSYIERFPEGPFHKDVYEDWDKNASTVRM